MFQAGPFPQPCPVTTNLLSISVDLPIPDIPHRRGGTTCDPCGWRFSRRRLQGLPVALRQCLALFGCMTFCRVHTQPAAPPKLVSFGSFLLSAVISNIAINIGTSFCVDVCPPCSWVLTWCSGCAPHLRPQHEGSDFPTLSSTRCFPLL